MIQVASSAAKVTAEPVSTADESSATLALATNILENTDVTNIEAAKIRAIVLFELNFIFIFLLINIFFIPRD